MMAGVSSQEYCVCFCQACPAVGHLCLVRKHPTVPQKNMSNLRMLRGHHNGHGKGRDGAWKGVGLGLSQLPTVSVDSHGRREA